MFDIKGKTILITGGAGILGSAFSKKCGELKANVVIVDVDEKRGEKLAGELKKETKNPNIIFYKCDITNEHEVKKLMSDVVAEFKTIDVLVNNAYPRNKNYGRIFEDVTYKDFCENVDMHLGGYFLVAREASKIMVKQSSGSIINMGSIYGIVGPDFRIYEGTDMTMPVEYSAIKAGIINFTRYLAAYLGKNNIRVNSISPGGVLNKQPESFVKNYMNRTPLGRMAEPEDIVGGVVFLASDESSYVTGHNLVIDGGLSIW